MISRSTGGRWRFRALRLTIARYTALLFATGGIALVLVAMFTAGEIAELNRVSEQSRARAASEEVGREIGSIVAHSRELLREVALWDETRTMLGDPATYAFWQTDRLMNPARVPHYVLEMGLYDQAGESLGDSPNSLMPGNITGPMLYAVVPDEADAPALALFIPVLGPRGEWPPIGFAGILADLQLALEDRADFQNLRQETLRFAIPPGTEVSAGELASFARFELPLNFTLQPLVETIKRSLVAMFAINLAVLLAGLWLARNYLAKPLQQVVEYVVALDGAPHEPPAPPLMRIRELAGLVRVVNRYDKRIRGLNEDLDKKNAELWQLAHLDPLTEIGNRLAFEEEWNAVSSGKDRRFHEVSFLMFDCDQLKYVNDHFGHDVGDAVIRRVADVLQSTLRDGDRLYRLGGDEFATILKNAGRRQASRIGKRCLDAVSAVDVTALGLDAPLSVSVGLAHASAENHARLVDLPRLADHAMYQGKGKGVVTVAAAVRD